MKRVSLVLICAWVFSLGVAMFQGISYLRDRSYVFRKAREITAGASSDREKVEALVRYLKEHVKQDPLPIFIVDRPFLRYDARDVLVNENAYCGEAARTLIILLKTLGIRARRVNLYGPAPHVAAEVNIDHRWVMEDPQVNQFVWPRKEITLKEVMESRLNGWNDFSTLNLRRLGLNYVIGSSTRIKTPLPQELSYFLESPHLQKMTAFLILFVLSFLAWAAMRLFTSG